MRILLATMLFIFSAATSVAHATELNWKPAVVCDGGVLEIDQAESAEGQKFEQIVLRGNMVNWMVNQTNLLPRARINPRGEIIQQRTFHPGSMATYWALEEREGAGAFESGVRIIVLTNISPAQAQAQAYNRVEGLLGSEQRYNFQTCEVR